MNSKQTGKLGEDIAVRYLKQKEYKILDRNFQRKVSRFLKSEIDIVAEKDNVICFIEVKALKGGQGFSPEQKVDFQKQKKLARTAEAWLVKRKIPLDSKWQIDIISIKIPLGPTSANSEKHEIAHFENAVSF